MAAKLARWVLFSILFSLIPLFVDFVAELARTHGHTSGFGRHGELYLLASAICAVGLGEILGVNQKMAVPKIIAGGMSAIVLCGATALYTISASDAAIEILHEAGKTSATDVGFYSGVLQYSWAVFLFACIISTSCIALSDVE